MEANKDKGTTVGFSKVEKEKVTFYGKELKVSVVNTVCKEHEWHLIAFRPTSNSDFIHESRCRNCGILKPTDFKVKENLSVINKQEWEDIWNEYSKSPFFDMYENAFYDWLKQYFLAPGKKNP